MISSTPSHLTQPSYSFFDSVSKTVQKTQKTAYESLWIPISTGAAVGMCDLLFGISLATFLCTIPGVEEFLADPSVAAEYVEDVSESFWDTAIEAPFIEEVIFRLVIQDFFKKAAQFMVPDQEIEVFSKPMKLATLVAVVATALLFGWAHVNSGLGIVHVILATVSGITYGILKEQYGLRSSISAHMFNNAAVYGLGRLS